MTTAIDTGTREAFAAAITGGADLYWWHLHTLQHVANGCRNSGAVALNMSASRTDADGWCAELVAAGLLRDTEPAWDTSGANVGRWVVTA